MACPDSECHDNLSRIGRCVHDIKEELKEMKDKFLTVKNAKWFLGGIVFVAVVIGGAWAKTQIDIRQLEKRDVKFETRQENILQALQKIPTKGDIYRIVNKQLTEKEKLKLINE